MFLLFNTLGRKKQEFHSFKKEEVSFYTCGPTVYNFAHIGNFRAYLSADTLRLWLIHGHKKKVKWVLNITDVDDKTIRDSQKKFPNLTPIEALTGFTRFYEDAFFSDLEKFNIKKDDFFANPRATDCIPAMQNLIRAIAKNGFAKETKDGIFFEVQKWATADKYGKLLSLDLSSLKSGTRTLADEIEKEDVADFALWKAEKPNEPAWDFDFFGENVRGRPGWHLECSAMEKELLGIPFDIHSGGVDLCFPHHEDEIAQSKCGYGVEPTAYWMHNEHLLVDGKKMSKSLENFYTLRDLLEKGHSEESIRFFLVTNHYRSKLNLTDEGLQSADTVIKKFRNFTRLSQAGEGCLRNTVTDLIHESKTNFVQAMDDDLNTPLAVAVIHGMIAKLQPFFPFSVEEQSKITDFFNFTGSIFGISFLSQKKEIPENILLLVKKREQARRAKNWQESDRLRDEIFLQGYEIRDSSVGFDLFPVA